MGSRPRQVPPRCRHLLQRPCPARQQPRRVVAGQQPEPPPERRDRAVDGLDAGTLIVAASVAEQAISAE